MVNKMKHEYHERPKAGENFEKFARAVFQKPKEAIPHLSALTNGRCEKHVALRCR